MMCESGGRKNSLQEQKGMAMYTVANYLGVNWI